ncbi:hypothetical protein FAES_3977 [Fibrella aestuarina BUZ 2]|uniref:Uncharacterized protein n=1 Tax=Fibrella aestuarina BUZ 2 TaxID=1166018 RepID=I0KCX5_9BACT|nr:hypothetical protein [Fibrella aestuarina]CCH01978.1 hypothetical protein FAES_3977 [Fibrella aestuarina BUZ 2]
MISTGLDLAIAINMAENRAGNVLSKAAFKLTKNKYLKKQYNGLKANVKYASNILARNGDSITIHLAFSNKNEMNAYVTKLRMYKSRYLIVCYAGLYDYCHNLFMWLMSSNKFFPIIFANPKVDVTDDIEKLSKYLVINKKIDLSRLSVPYILSNSVKDDIFTKGSRNDYALLLTSIAVEFLFFHEMTHIDHGHIDYLKNTVSGFETLYSLDDTNTASNQLHNDIIGLEQEADLGAAEFLFDSYWDLQYKGTLMKLFDTFLTSTDNLIFTIFYSLVWLFHLVQDCREYRGLASSNCHPSPECRILSVFRIFYVLSKNKNGNPDLVQKQFAVAIENYLATCEVSGITPHIKPNIFSSNSLASQELIRVEETRLRLLKELKPYQYSRKF